MEYRESGIPWKAFHIVLSSFKNICQGNTFVTACFVIIHKGPVIKKWKKRFHVITPSRSVCVSVEEERSLMCCRLFHYNDVITSTMASQITSLTIIYSSVYPGADHRKYQSSASLAFVREIHRSPVNSPHKGPVTRKMFPSNDVIMFHYGVIKWKHFPHDCPFVWVNHPPLTPHPSHRNNNADILEFLCS